MNGLKLKKKCIHLKISLFIISWLCIKSIVCWNNGKFYFQLNDNYYSIYLLTLHDKETKSFDPSILSSSNDDGNRYFIFMYDEYTCL
jgi:hypothetical protein